MNTQSVPSEAVLIYNNALELTSRGEFSTALTEYQKAIDRHPTFIEAYNNIGEIYTRMGKTTQAIAAYNRALQIDRNHRVLLNIGVEYYNNSQFDRSLEFFIESLRYKNDFMEGNLYAAMVYHRFRNYIEAEKYLLKVTAQDRNHIKANYILSHIYYEWKEYRKAIACLDCIKDTADNREFINRYYGFCYYFLEDYTNAVKYLGMAMESNPAFARFREYVSSLTYENRMKEIGDIDRAIRELEEKMMSQDRNIQELKKLGILYIYKGRSQEAEDLFLSVKEKMVS